MSGKCIQKNKIIFYFIAQILNIYSKIINITVLISESRRKQSSSFSPSDLMTPCRPGAQKMHNGRTFPPKINTGYVCIHYLSVMCGFGSTHLLCETVLASQGCSMKLCLTVDESMCVV